MHELSLRKCTPELNMKGFSPNWKLENWATLTASDFIFQFHPDGRGYCIFYSIGCRTQKKTMIRLNYFPSEWPRTIEEFYVSLTFSASQTQLRFAACALFHMESGRKKMNCVAVSNGMPFFFLLSLVLARSRTHTQNAKTGDPTKVLYFVMRYHFDVYAGCGFLCTRPCGVVVICLCQKLKSVFSHKSASHSKIVQSRRSALAKPGAVYEFLATIANFQCRECHLCWFIRFAFVTFMMTALDRLAQFDRYQSAHKSPTCDWGCVIHEYTIWNLWRYGMLAKGAVIDWTRFMWKCHSVHLVPLDTSTQLHEGMCCTQLSIISIVYDHIVSA